MIQKKSKNFIISFSLIFIIIFSFLGSCFVRPVFASDIQYSFSPSNAVESDYSVWFNAFLENSFLDDFDGKVNFYVTQSRYGGVYVFIILDPVRVSNNNNDFWYGSYYWNTFNSTDSLKNNNFTFTDVDPSNYTDFYWCIYRSSSSSSFYDFGEIKFSPNGPVLYAPQFKSFACFSFSNEKIYNPDDYQVVNPFFSLDVDDFYTWLVNNDKIQVSGDSGGVSVGGKIPSYIGVQKLKSFLTFYKNFGSSNQSFVRHIVDWFSFMNIASQTKDNINILKSTTDALYQEYINYRSGTHAYWPTATKIQKRQNIDTVTDDDNTSLITDDNSDTLDISLLRDILRGVIAISNNLIDGVSKIVSALNQLDFTVNVANDGGVGFSASDIWGSGDITESENYLSLTAAFMDKGVDVSAAENMKINYLDNATQQNSFTVSVVMPDQFVNGQFTEKTVTHTIDNTSKMYNTLLLFRKLIAFAVIVYFAIRIRFELPNLIRGE